MKQEAFTAFYQPPVEELPHFDGATYDAAADQARLTGQIKRVLEAASDGAWHTLQELADTTGDPHSSISAQLRNLRKVAHGGYTVNRRVRGDRSHGLYEYQVVVPRER